mmetsp:Transcript_23935/g.39464  ORF Transcript_23935/g.39464 Transcript_23935/m.39464 type:complete len:680 (+) Transcript_23935:107-2146(+)
MMHRKKHAGGDKASFDNTTKNNSADDGGSAKRKNRPVRTTMASTALTITNLVQNMCLPGVPVALKLVLLSFLAFALLMVLTAKARRAHFHYKHNKNNNNEGGLIRGGPGMPVPLVEQLAQKLHLQNNINSNKNTNYQANEDSDSAASASLSSMEATKRMLAQPSKFVDAEKKLKQQLLHLLEKQTTEQKSNGEVDPNLSVLGVKISNRYLGEDLLPYPESKQAEEEWEHKMNQRKEELRKQDEIEWKALMERYNEVMVDYVEENEHADHNAGLHEVEQDVIDSKPLKPQQHKQQQPVSEVKHAKSDENTTWPAPSKMAGDDATILLKPAFGTHRPLSNAILVFAEGYDLSIYLSFVESLANTGYSGDVVFSISNESKLKPGVKEYLLSKSDSQSDKGVNIIAYEVEWTCFKKSGESARGSGEGINHCKMNSVFGDSAGNPVDDPREPRPVATARYELYWIWSLQYSKESWLMLLDVRDVWFQLDPFEQVNARGKVTGELHLFGENADAVRIGTSAYNKGWLVTAYGRKTVSSYFDEPVICSGSTMGNQDAIETYLRAMVAQFDSTKCKSKGCDQGFHNYLYYSGQLGKVDDETTSVGSISKLVVHEQGKGAINNLGALRTKPLKEWGMYDAEKELVLNWDGSTSPVAHQYDRDKEVNIMVKAKKKEFEQQWRLGKPNSA